MSALPQLRLGNWLCTCLRDTSFWLDGGTMFHVVPKAVWERKVSADKDNLISVALNCLLLDNGDKKILIDTGIGNRLSKKQADYYKTDSQKNLLQDFVALSLKPEDIDVVILTHLHFDHTGWCLRPDSTNQDKLVPTFPNARYVVQESEWEAAHQTNELTAGSYRLDDFALLEDYSLLELVAGETEIVPELKVALTGAHSPGHQIAILTSSEGCLLNPGEMLPDRHHFRIPWVMSYDLMPAMVVEIKRTLLRAAVEENWFVFLFHEMGLPFGKVEQDSGRQSYRFVSLES